MCCAIVLMSCTILTSGSIDGALHEKCWKILYKCIFIVNREEGSDESNRPTVLSIDQVYYIYCNNRLWLFNDVTLRPGNNMSY
jgi:hypothetical protein